MKVTAIKEANVVTKMFLAELTDSLKMYEMNQKEKGADKKSRNVGQKSEIVEEDDDDDMDLPKELALFTKELGRYIKVLKSR